MPSTRDQALAWLRTKGTAVCVGQRGRPGCCPLANLLRETANAPDPAVFKETYRMNRYSSQTTRLGQWAIAAVAAVDSGGPRCEEVTAGELLPIWERIPEQ